LVFNIQQFEIKGLHGNRNYIIDFIDNKLVLIGENGTGKSTVITLLYYFISEQWIRLKEYNYLSLCLKFNGIEYSLTKEQIDAKAQESSPTEVEFGGLDGLVSIIEARINKSTAIKAEKKKESPVNFDFLGDTKLIFLPTYRRIEQSLDSIYRLVEKKRRQSFPDTVNFNFTKDFQDFFEGKNFKELIEFGMNDIEKIIKNKETSLKESFRNSLNELTGNYLKDVINKKYNDINYDIIKSADFARLESILDRIEDKILTEYEKNSLISIISKIQSETKIGDEDKVIIHFLSQLIKKHSEQITKEADVFNFTRVCNKYLVDKEVVYDNKNFVIKIQHKNEKYKNKNNKLDLHVLSSGEKQIISLFSHLYLSDIKSFIIIIDEPELSLSVPWQFSFLPDIINTQKCGGVIAVTHSPFIYDNDLSKYTKEISEFRREDNEPTSNNDKG
jgi:predicted ATPase